MSTVRTPQNTVNENEEVNVDKTVRATNFDPSQCLLQKQRSQRSH